MKAKAYTKGIANPHTHCQRIANPLERADGRFQYKTKRQMRCIKHLLLVWIAVFSAVILQAQEQLEVELIGESRSYSSMVALDKNEFLVVTNGDENGQIALCHMITDGTELEYVNQPQLNEQGYSMMRTLLFFFIRHLAEC